MVCRTEQDKEKPMNKIKTCLKYAIMGLICALSFLKPCDARADASSYWYDYLDTSYEVVVSAPDGYVNFRYGPDTGYDIITQIPNGTYLTIEALGDEQRDHDYHWGQTEYNGHYGWVALSQVKSTGRTFDKEEPAEEEEPSKESDFTSAPDKVISKASSDYDEEDEEAQSSSAASEDTDEEAASKESEATEEEVSSESEASEEEISDDEESSEDVSREKDDSSDTGLSFKHKVIIIALIVVIAASAAIAVLIILLLKKK